MGLAKPDIKTSKPFSDVFEEGQPFILDGIRTVKARSATYGDGEMVVMKVRNQPDELSIWGTYLLAQANDADESDFGKHYVLTTKVVEGFSKRPVKCLVPFDPETNQQIPF